MSFDFLDNVLLLDLTLETPEGILDSFALLNFYLCQTKKHLPTIGRFTSGSLRKVLI